MQMGSASPRNEEPGRMELRGGPTYAQSRIRDVPVRGARHFAPGTFCCFSLFTWDDMIGTDENRQELDIE